MANTSETKAAFILMERPGDKIDSEMGVRNEHNAVARKDVHQGFAHQFSVGISESLIRDFPYLTVRSSAGFRKRHQALRPNR